MSWPTLSGTRTAPADWSAGVPGPSDTAVFATGASTLYTVSGTGTAGTLMVNDR